MMFRPKYLLGRWRDIVIMPPEKKAPKKIDLEAILKILGLFATALSLFFTFRSLQDAQTWKVAEFTASEFKKFSDKPNVKIVNTLLDYNQRLVPFFPKDSMIVVNDIELYEALVVDSLQSDFTPVDVKIRDAFDEYFDELALFNKYLDAGLIDKEQLEPYIHYQVDIIANLKNTSKSEDLKRRIWLYLRYYKFNDVLSLFKKMGYTVNPG